MDKPWRVPRIGVGLLAAAGAVAAMVSVVLPALARHARQPAPRPSTQVVLPVDVNTGGQSNDCAVFGSTAHNQFRISNPKSQTYTTTVNGTSVTFTLTLNPDGAKTLPAYANEK